MKIEQVLGAYIECALWSTGDGDYENLEDFDVAETSVTDMRDDVRAFLHAAEARGLLEGLDPEQTGHDFWLTRNRHGVGFWARGLGSVGEELTRLSHSFGESDLYVGDDGLVHLY